MRDETKIAVLVGRLLDLLSRGPETTDDHRTALHALVDLLARRSATLVVEEGTLTVEGVVIPEPTPFLDRLSERLAVHEVARLQFAHGPSPVDLVQTLRALAEPPSRTGAGRALEDRLRREGVTAVVVVSRESEAGSRSRRGVRVTDALQTASGPRPAHADLPEVVPAARGAAYEEMVRQQKAQASTLAAAVARLADEYDSRVLLGKLDQVQAGIAKAVATNELNQALEAVLRLIRQEGESQDPDVQRVYGVALRRILTADTLRRFAPLVFDDMYHDDIVMMMRRAGTQGTKLLLDLLIDAPSQAERRAYLRALRQVEEGTDVVTSLLNHHEWYVVRNAADLAGELGIAEAVPALGRAVHHDDPRVRRSVGIALARIGTPETAAHLRKMLGDAEREVRVAVLREIGGRTLSGLAMPLVTAAEAEADPEVLAEYFQALGRIGTPDAVQALVKAAQASGGILSRRPVGPRLAAIAALGVAGSPAAVETLRALAARRGDGGSAATAALRQARAAGATAE